MVNLTVPLFTPEVLPSPPERRGRKIKNTQEQVKPLFLLVAPRREINSSRGMDGEDSTYTSSQAADACV